MNKIVEAVSNGAKIGFLIGAGVSVNSGLPDFRSPGGMYDTLRPELLTANAVQKQRMKSDPTTVVSWWLFKDNQLPYHEVRRPFILGIGEGKWKPTLFHYFIRLCQDKGLLEMLFSCNIDGLDRAAGVTKIVNVHGSIGNAKCEFCDADYPWPEYIAAVKTHIKDIYSIDPTAPEESSLIPCLTCKAPGVKPATVLYGRALPQTFFEAMTECSPKLDVLIVAGTSLTVAPSNLVPLKVREDCVRCVVNREKCGEDLGLGERAKDVFLLGECDEETLNLVEALGWLPDLAKFADNMCDNSKALLLKRLGK